MNILFPTTLGRATCPGQGSPYCSWGLIKFKAWPFWSLSRRVLWPSPQKNTVIARHSLLGAHSKRGNRCSTCGSHSPKQPAVAPTHAPRNAGTRDVGFSTSCFALLKTGWPLTSKNVKIECLTGRFRSKFGLTDMFLFHHLKFCC